MKIASFVLTLAAALAIAGTVLAQDKESGKQRRGPRPGMGRMSLFANVEKLDLTSDQKAKLADIKKEFEPKIKEAQAKVESILTPEQKKARDEAIKAAAGKGREARASIQEATKLTDDQKAKMAEARKAMGEVAKQVREKIASLLTADQKEKLEKMRGAGRRGPRAKSQ